MVKRLAFFFVILLLFIPQGDAHKVNLLSGCDATKITQKVNSGVSTSSGSLCVRGDEPGGAAPSQTNLLVSQEFGRRVTPTAIDSAGIPPFISTLEYTMAIGETHGFLMRLNENSTVTLSCTGTDVSNGDVTCTFYKVWSYFPDNSDKWRRASLSSSPATGTDAYMDGLVEIPSGSNNFTPEVNNVDEYVWLDIAIATDATPDAEADFVINLGSISITPALEIVNFTMPVPPTIPLISELPESSISLGQYGSYQSDASKASLLGNYTDLMKAHRVVVQKNSLAFLTDNGTTLLLTAGSGDGGSWEQMQIDKYTDVGWMHMWHFGFNNQTEGDEAEGTIAAESAIASGEAVYYFADEPDCDSVTATIKATLDHWDVQSPGTFTLLTTNDDCDETADAGTSGLDFTDYSQLVLTPVIQHLSSGVTPVTDYPNGLLGFYTSCQNNCGPQANTDSTTGTDTGYVDLAYLDYPAARLRATFWLVQRSTWRDKMKWLLYYNTITAHSEYGGVDITPIADTSGSMDGDYIVLDGPNGSVCFWVDINNSGTSQPAGACAAADSQEEITALVTDDTADTVASAFHAEIDARSEFVAYLNTATTPDTINVMGGVDLGTQDVGTSGFTFAFDESTSSWNSVRRFNVMGDGTWILPNIGGFKPFVGIAAFTKGNDTASPMIRLKHVRDGSYETDALAIYHTREGGTPVADNVTTDGDTFETEWGEYEYLRWRVYKANAAGNSIASHTLSASYLRFMQEPTNQTEDTSISPAITVKALNRLGGLDSSHSSNCVISIASGTGTLGGTTTVAPSSGVCTFSNITIDTPGEFTLEVASSGLTSVVSSSITISEALAVEDPSERYTTNLIRWWDMTLLAEGNGVTVATIEDQTTNNKDFTQATDGERGTAATNALNSLKGLDCGGVDENYNVSGGDTGYGSSGIITYCIVYTTWTNGTMLSQSSGGAFLESNSTTYSPNSNEFTITLTGDAIDTSNVMCVESDYTADDYTVYLDGVSRGTSSAGMTVPTGELRLCDVAGVSTTDATILEIFMLDKLRSSSERFGDNAYINDKYGLSLPTE